MSRKKQETHTPIIVAIVSLLGIIITAIFSYCSSLAPVKLSIQATLTEEANLASQIIVPKTTQQNISSMIEVSISDIPCQMNNALVLPSQISPAKDSLGVLEQIEDSLNKSWPIAPVNGSNIYKLVKITNISELGEEWIFVGSTINAKLYVISQTVDHINLWLSAGACGGGEYKTFSQIVLNHDRVSLNQHIASNDFDFFTLMPGEFDIFLLNFSCQAPGVYRPIISLTFNLSDQSETTPFFFDEIIICPESYSYWETDYSNVGYPPYYPLNYLGDFLWDGLDYEETP